MNFCNNCGTKLTGESVFCTNCGQKNEPAAAASDAHQKRESNAAPTIAEPKLSKQEKKSKKPRRLWILASAAVLILAASGFFFYAKKESDPGDTAALFINSVKEKQMEELSGMVVNADTGKALNLDELKHFSSLLEELPQLTGEVEKSISGQEAYLREGSGKKPVPYLFELSRKKDKKLLLIDQYEVLVHPVSFSVNVNEDTQLFVNSKEVDLKGSSIYTAEDVLPGRFYLRALKGGEFGELETEKSMEIWKDPEEPIDLLFEEEYVTIENPLDEIDLYLDGEKYITSSDSVIQAGPIPAGRAVTIQASANYPWGEAETEEYVANAGDKINLKVRDSFSKEMQHSLIQNIYSFNQSYVDSITYVDADYLVNVRSKKLDSILDTIDDLKKRNVSYVGEISSMTFDAASLKVGKRGTDYIATILAKEEYMSGWKDRDATEEPELKSKTYYYTYEAQYDPYEQEWIVIGNTEHDSVEIKEPLVVRD